MQTINQIVGTNVPDGALTHSSSEHGEPPENGLCGTQYPLETIYNLSVASAIVDHNLFLSTGLYV